MIAFQGLKKAFGGQTVLDNVTFRVEDSSLCGLVGPNGAGKTTLLRIAADIVRAEVLLSVRERRAVDYQSEAYTLYITPSFTRTLEFLREDDRYAFPKPPTVARAEIFRFDPVVGQKSYIWTGQDLFLRASDFYCFPDYVEYNIIESRKHGYGYELLTPPEIPADRFPDFLPRLRSCWYASREVYVVRLTVPNDTNIIGDTGAGNIMGGTSSSTQEKEKYIYKYLPADKAPDFLLEYLPE